MSVYVFIGPTISAADARVELDAIYLPPVSEGDVYRAAAKRPAAIGIIDGYFQSAPSVWHKEVLWAMSRGIHVFGSASMGALRAAELAAFGMEGVGSIFEAYRDGTLEDDDEVAVAHGPEELGFPAVSEAMANIRQTLLKAEQQRVIPTRTRVKLEKIAKELFYPQRNYAEILRLASERGVTQGHVARFREWLPGGKVNRKRDDALAMLRVMRQRLEMGLEPKTVAYVFEHTTTWERAWRGSGDLHFRSDDRPETIGLNSVLDEIRLDNKAYERARRDTLARFLSIHESDRQGIQVTTQDRQETEAAFRRERGLSEPAQMELWLKSNGLSAGDLAGLMMDEARVRRIGRLAESQASAYLPDELRLSGEYPRLLARAAAKQRLLEYFGLENPSPESAGLTEDQLLSWYFEQILGRPAPPDIVKYSLDSGFGSPEALRRALLKEFLYRRLDSPPKEGDRQ